MSVRVNALDHLVINVSDVARSTEWYRKILGMEVRVFDPGPGKTPRTSLVFGNQKINVRPAAPTRSNGSQPTTKPPGATIVLLTSSTPDEWCASEGNGSESRKARWQSKAPEAGCVRSIAGSRWEFDRDFVV